MFMFRVVSVICLVAAFPGVAISQAAFPNKPVKVVLPYAPGGANDVAFRALGSELEAMWGQALIVESKPGAGGRLAYEHLAHAAPDGYTLANIVSSLTTLPYLFKDLGFDPRREIVGVGSVLKYENVLSISADLPATNLREFIAYAKANPGKLNYGAQGYGNIVHLTSEVVNRAFGIKTVGVIYKGSGEMMAAAIRGDIQIIVGSRFSVEASKGRMRIIAVGSDARVESLPDVPTLKEAGIEFVPFSWIGIGAPGGTPRPIVNKIAADVATVFRKPEFVAKVLKATGAIVYVKGPEDFGQLLQSEFKNWGELIGQLGLKPE
jgi:tripartite-type tricarboxylate transporter receptor subunit TctC